MTAKEKILERLAHTEIPLCLFQLKIGGVSETAASARLREMKKEGLVVSVAIPGRKYTAWSLVPKDLVLPLVGHPSKADSTNSTMGALK